MRKENPRQSEEGASACARRLSGPVRVDKEKFVAAARNSAGKGEWKEERDSPGHAQIASCSATPGLWLGNRTVRSHLIGVDRYRNTVGEVTKVGRRTSNRTKERID